MFSYIDPPWQNTCAFYPHGNLWQFELNVGVQTFVAWNLKNEPGQPFFKIGVINCD